MTHNGLSVLMIGNSFSICVGNHLPGIVRSAPGCELRLTSAYIGGCSLERHWNNILETEADPAAAQYRVTDWATDGTNDVVKTSHEAMGSINELIGRDAWDIITIQQASHFSWNYTTYQPFADNLVAYIREHAPRARIWIQQTWAYNAADGRLGPNGSWGFDQAGMHLRASESYAALARHLGNPPVIHTGDAVALYRARKAPDAPDVVGNEGDTIHLNHRGEYLQACVWFLALYGRDGFPENVYVPENFISADAAMLRQCAIDARPAS